MIDLIKGNENGTTEESTVQALLARKAISLPSAKGKRGPRKN
jgi:hypothetical protein